jgi:hypothetical protein
MLTSYTMDPVMFAFLRPSLCCLLLVEDVFRVLCCSRHTLMFHVAKLSNLVFFFLLMIQQIFWRYLCWWIHSLAVWSIFVSTVLFCWSLAAFSISWSYTQLVRLLGRGISPSLGRYLHTEQHKQNKTQTDIHALSEIQTHDQSVLASEDSSCPRPCGRPAVRYYE